MPSSNSRSTASVVRRSKNPFLLYRRDAVTSGAVSRTFVNSDGESKYKTQMEISREVGKMWNSAPEGVKILYRGMAAELTRGALNNEESRRDLIMSYPDQRDITSNTPGVDVGVHPCNTQMRLSPDCHACSTDATLTVPQDHSLRAPTGSRIQPDGRLKRQARNATVTKAKIPRPENAFILYRRQVLASGAVATRFTGDRGLERPRTQSEMSKDIATMWHNAPQKVKSYYSALAEEKRKEHKKKYPGYKFSPKPPRKAKQASSKLFDPSLVSKPAMKGCSCRCSCV
ncbi:hypothetical protein AAF712_014917 [Marasmius tenuissimus]|uniref:HMG box domain-containing protein n=1 Tax=Marasmius tenuissimus TaxID=585030 RepID=A0ABR2Z9Z5_9AGAR